jgi:hypothetical protein
LNFFSRAAELLRHRIGQKSLIAELSHQPPRLVVDLPFFGAARKEVICRPLPYPGPERKVILIEKR